MISPHTQTDLANAKMYYKSHLAIGNYYAEKNIATGQWLGEGAARLGLTGIVQESAFAALCEGNDPNTGNRLTARRNSVRQKDGKWVANKRVLYDWTISPPKSVSLVALLQDSRIIAAHNRAVQATLQELEAFAETRVRLNGAKNEVRPTSNLVVACFRHETSRELDPQLHTHCIVFNATFDPAEGRWKALQTHGMFKAQRFANGVYEHELCRELQALGYRIRSTGKNFEIEGISQEAIDRFSKRRRQIDAETAKRVARVGPAGNVKDIREQVAHDKRRRKNKEATAEKLRQSWFKELAPAERTALQSLRAAEPGTSESPADLPALLSWAERHVFERNAVLPQHERLAAALARGRGQTFSLSGLRDAMRRMESVFFLEKSEVTSRELVRLEMDLDLTARKAVRSHEPLNPEFFPDAGLSDEQRRAVSKIMESRSFITLFRGAAGTGKSTSLREVRRGLLASNHPVVVLAPQRQQVLDLENDGLPALTLAKFLMNPQFPKGAVILADESGQIGIRDMHRLVTLARAEGARLILSGDTRQHGAVAASDALVLLERYAGVPVARLRNIRRQDPRLVVRAEKEAVAAYRSAVRLASRGKAAEALDALDGLGWVREHRPEEGRRHLAQNYLQALNREERPLVVAQTWHEVESVNVAVRAALNEAGRLGPSTRLASYRTVDLTAAEKQDAASYGRPATVVFLKIYGRYRRGDICPVLNAGAKGITLLKNGRRATLAYRYADRLTVIKERPLELAPGDRLQLKMNGRSFDGKPFANGELATVREVQPDGKIVIESDRGQQKILSANQRVFNYGYATTSYGSQGKTVDTVLFSDSGSRLATHQKQFYVTISRGRRRVLVFTPDKAALRRAVAAEGHRTLAVEGAKARALGPREGNSQADWHQHLMDDTSISPAESQGTGIRL
jgi:conjugative relaxase-like TrwC/TraI family protein